MVCIGLTWEEGREMRGDGGREVSGCEGSILVLGHVVASRAFGLLDPESLVGARNLVQKKGVRCSNMAALALLDRVDTPQA